jgi:murein DD-endopeptidase MepM/ murein hydrolase activator NlpD
MNNWKFPLKYWNKKIPLNEHPGAFGARRKYDYHTGVDLYTRKNAEVIAVENGVVVAIEDFTGTNAGSPWWKPTKAVLVEGRSGVICYGEIEPHKIKVSDIVLVGQTIGYVKEVLDESKIREDIIGHSNCMLHIELYTKGTVSSVIWPLNHYIPTNLENPTSYLLEAFSNRTFKEKILSYFRS